MTQRNTRASAYGLQNDQAENIAYEAGPTIPSIDGSPPSVRAMLDHLRSFENGTFTESFDAAVTESGGVVTMSLEQAGGGDLTMNFSGQFSVLATTPAATIILTAGTNKIPKKQYVYILQSDKILTVGDSGWPAAEHIKVAFAFVPSAAFINTYGGVYSIQNHNEHAQETEGASIGQGHMTDLSARSRRFGAVWLEGCQGVATQDGNDLWVSIAVGAVMQMHEHAFTALDSDAPASDPILVVNGSGNEYAVIHSLNEITTHSDGTSIGNNKYVKFVLWAAANKTGELSPMFLNLPSGEYNSTANALRDVDGKSDFTLPAAFGLESSTGFLVAAFVCKHTGAGMILQGSAIDLRGAIPATAPGSGTGGGDVSAAAALADNAVIRGDGGAKDIQDSGVLIDDNDEVTGVASLAITDSASIPPLNITERSATPSAPSANDIYLDDGTNTASGNPGWRRYTGAVWEDIIAVGLTEHHISLISGGTFDTTGFT